MRLIWHSNAPWNGSGYGVQTAMFVPRIASLGHEIIISAPYSFGGNVLQWEDWKVLPCVRDPAGTDVISAHYEFFKADALITLADVFGLLKCADALAQMNVAHWFPVDTNPLGEGDVTVLREGRGVPIAMSRFGERILQAEGADPVLYVPHGVDTDVFSPGDPSAYRDTVPQIGPDTLVIGLVAMNRDPQRKSFSEQLLAFSRFHARHPDSVMSLHTVPVAPTPAANLHGLCARLGISGAVVFPEPYLYDTGMITREQLATWYNGLDVLSFCSYAEGFGLPLIEAQACGIPVITTDGSAMSELCGAGWLVSGTPFWTNGHGAWWKRPDVDDIEQAYEITWQAKQDGTLPRKPARDFAMLYSADRVFDQFWKPTLAELEKRFM
jgi:glycosyltransferase involved in cell wall biosynthesis